jgi:DNA-binding MarR family transcriptional regulator
MPGPAAHSRALARLFDDTVRLYLRLSALSTKMHGGGQLSGPRRTVLVGLARSGPQTVAHMARQRTQSRQRFQPLVNALLRDGLVRAVPNAAHRQSPLIELTVRGRAAVARIHAVEERGRRRVAVGISAISLARSAAVLRAVTADLERELDGITSGRRRGRTARDRSPVRRQSTL